MRRTAIAGFIDQMPTLALLRHGPTEWTAARRLQGRTDIGLSDLGRSIVGDWRLPDRIVAFDWVTSPLRRCRETAVLLCRQHRRACPSPIESRLAEMSFGDWEGRTLADLRAEHGRAMAEWESAGLDFRAPGGESPRDLQARLQPWLAGLRQDTLAITHKGVMRAIHGLATDWDMRQKSPQRLLPDAIQVYAIEPGGGLRVVSLNLPVAPAHAAGEPRR